MSKNKMPNSVFARLYLSNLGQSTYRFFCKNLQTEMVYRYIRFTLGSSMAIILKLFFTRFFYKGVFMAMEIFKIMKLFVSTSIMILLISVVSGCAQKVPPKFLAVKPGV